MREKEARAGLCWRSCSHLALVSKDGLNAYVFLLAVLHAKGEGLALAPIYLVSLFSNPGEFVRNTVRLMDMWSLK